MNIFSVLANITDPTLATQFLNEQQINNATDVRQYASAMGARYFNPNTPLADAQKIADNYMLMKQKKPMVIEYYKHSPHSGPNYLESVEMYINPNKLNVQNQKVKGKVYTRGGIFYHHWGDDHPSMQLSGITGLSGMKGIEQLEKIYYNSGTLLKYKNAGPQVVNANNQGEYTPPDYNNPSSILSTVIGNTNENVLNDVFAVIAEKKKTLKLQSEKKQYEIVEALLNNYNNLMNQAKYQAEYQKIQDTVLKAKMENNLGDYYSLIQSKINASSEFANCSDDIKTILAFELALTFSNSKSDINSAITLLNSQLDIDLNSNTIIKTYDIATQQATQLNDYIQAVHDVNRKLTVNRDIATLGWKDIEDEVFDEWRPRLIFIYFEDRVYIGHFDSFSWDRVAEHPLIAYNMKFTIIRQIIITSNNPDKQKPFISPNATINNNQPPNITDADKDSSYWRNNIEEAKYTLLGLIDDLTYNKGLKETNLQVEFTDVQEATIKNKINDIRSAISSYLETDEDIEMYNYDVFANWTLRLEWFSYPKKENASYIGITLATEGVKREITRSKRVYETLLQKGLLSEERKLQILRWVTQIREASGVTQYDNWEIPYQS